MEKFGLNPKKTKAQLFISHCQLNNKDYF